MIEQQKQFFQRRNQTPTLQEKPVAKQDNKPLTEREARKQEMIREQQAMTEHSQSKTKWK